MNSSSSTIQLGYCVPIEDEEQWSKVGHHHFHSSDWDGGQVGGVPSWLEPEHLPCLPLECCHCHARLQFVCQLYAPYSDSNNPDAFHRSLYLFACSACPGHSNSNVRVLRTQLSQQNPYWPSPKKIDKDEPERSQHENYHKNGLCVVCGFPASGQCPLQKLSFCSRDHQRLYKKHQSSVAIADDKDWRNQIASSVPGVYNAMEIVVEEEPSVEDAPPEAENWNDKAILFPSRKNDDDNDDDSDEDIEQDELNEIVTGKKKEKSKQTQLQDVCYQHFIDRITERPNVKDQVLRYNCSWPSNDNNEQPLWIRHDHRPPFPIPSCPYCGGERVFEFQLMPQLLHHLTSNVAVAEATTLETDSYATTVAALQQADAWVQQAPPEAVPPVLLDARTATVKRLRHQLLHRPRLDWGTVAVYTCAQSCHSTSKNNNGTTDATALGAYREEFAWVQPSVDDIV